jgi:hypothetical protein
MRWNCLTINTICRTLKATTSSVATNLLSTNQLLYCHVLGVRLTKIMGCGSYDWIYWCFLKITLNYSQYSTIADLHTFQFTVAHALGFSVFTSRILAMDLNTGTITWNHYEVFSLFLLESHYTPLSENVLNYSTLSLQSHIQPLFSLPSLISLRAYSCYIYAARTTQKTQFYCCMAQTTQKTTPFSYCCQPSNELQHSTTEITAPIVPWWNILPSRCLAIHSSGPIT